MTSENPRQGMFKDSSRRKAPSKKASGRKGMPKIMWLAIGVCVIGAVFLFYSSKSNVPTGIGENQTVITAEDVDTSGPATEAGPRSGEVDIADQTRDVVPEKPRGDVAQKADRPAEKPREKPPVRQETKPVAQASNTPPPAVVDSVLPAANGPYVVQVGSFGNAANADKEADRLKKLGWDAMVKMGNTASGDIIYRVRIGYFQSRSQASLFIQQNQSGLGQAIAVHR